MKSLAFVNQPVDRLLSPQQNSIALVTYHSAKELHRDFGITVICKQHPHDREAPADLPFTLRRVDAPADGWVQRFVHSHPRWAKRLRIEHLKDLHWQYRTKVAGHLRALEPDIFHVMNYWEWSRDLKRSHPSGKLVLEMHCEWLSQKDRDAVAEQLPAVDAVIGVSDHVISLFRAGFPDYRGLVAVVPNGVDCEQFKPAAVQRERTGKTRVLFVGRVSPEKGVHTLIAGFRDVAARFPDAELQIAGPPWALSPEFLGSLSSERMVQDLLRFYDEWGASTYRDHLDQLIQQAGLQERVKFLGNLSHEQLVEAYQCADVVVNPSFSESFGMSVIEAMACAIPVIATRVGGMRESIVEGETGLLVQPDDPAALAEGIVALLNDPGRASRMGKAGLQRVHDLFSWAARARELKSVYDQLSR